MKMNSSEYKKYTIQAKRGIKGEAFFESLVSDYSLPHHIVGPKDMGIDYICEWVYGDRPTGILYAAQVKTFLEESAKPAFVGVETRLNGLCKYNIPNPNLRIEGRTLNYWKGFGMPVYLFAVVQGLTGQGEERLDCYYKRFTPILTRDLVLEAVNFYSDFYKVNNGSLFMAFKDPEARTQGFARDLFIDHVRWCYHKGSITYLEPHVIGLNQFLEEGVFIDLFRDYKQQILSAYYDTKRYIEALGDYAKPT